MEKDIDLLQFFGLEPAKEIIYFAEYDILSNKVIKVGPDHAMKDVANKVRVENDLAIDIISGTKPISSFIVDQNEDKIILMENFNLVKIDDILHRIIEDKYSDDTYPDIHISLSMKNSTATVEASELWGGTKKIKGKKIANEKKYLLYQGNKNMIFHITEYNDPTIIYETFVVVVSDLVDKKVKIDLKNKLPKEFSIFTKRLFKKYSMTIK